MPATARRTARGAPCGICYVVDTVAARDGLIGFVDSRRTRRGDRKERVEPHEERPHVPGPSLWPVGFAVGIACVLVGLVVSWPVAAVGAVIALVFGFLWIRDVDRRVPRRAARGGRRRTAPRRPGGRRASEQELARLPAQQVPRAVHARARRGDRRASSPSRSSASRSCRPSSTRSSTTSTSARSTNFPEGKWSRRRTSRTPRRARSRGAPRTSATTASSAGRAQLHDHLQPLRPPRLPGAGERPARGRGRRRSRPRPAS